MGLTCECPTKAHLFVCARPVSHIMSELLNDLEDRIDRENLKRLLYYARRLAGFQSRVKYVLGSIAEVLESGKCFRLCKAIPTLLMLKPVIGVRKDEDLSAMYLSAKKVNEPRDTHDHEELELLLESFSKQVEEIMSEVDTIVVSLFICALDVRL